ncbi:MAG: response regulator transcription factor [bacterium]|nr:response regulator transcription factor [bacterium]
MTLYHGTLEIARPDKDNLEKLFVKYNISKREREVVHLICEGKTNKQIEDHLFISIQTVKDHVSNIFRKTGVKNRVQLTNLFRNP